MSNLVQKQRQKKERIVERQDKRPACGGIEELQKKAFGKKKRRRDGEGELDPPAERGDIGGALRDHKEDEAVEAVLGADKAGGLQQAVQDEFLEDVVIGGRQLRRQSERPPAVCQKERTIDVLSDRKALPGCICRIAVDGGVSPGEILTGVVLRGDLFEFHILPEHRVHAASFLRPLPPRPSVNAR